MLSAEAVHALENQSVRRLVEVLRDEHGLDEWQRGVVEEDRTEHGLFSLDVVAREALWGRGERTHRCGITFH